MHVIEETNFLAMSQTVYFLASVTDSFLWQYNICNLSHLYWILNVLLIYVVLMNFNEAMYYAFYIVPDAVPSAFVDDYMRLRSNACYAAEGFPPERRED